MLGAEFAAYEDVLQRDTPKRGIRVNPLKCAPENLLAMLGKSFGQEPKPSPFSPLSYYLPDCAENIGHLALHHAGAFYVQEPSASSAVTVLAPQPGERILDLCAAPGGKSTQIEALLGGTGLLWSMKLCRTGRRFCFLISKRMGVRAAWSPRAIRKVLCSALAGFFDRVLVDAPCSGKACSAKTDARRRSGARNTESCAVRQLANFAECAAGCARGRRAGVFHMHVFAGGKRGRRHPEFLRQNPEFALEDCGVSFGRPAFAARGGAEFDLFSCAADFSDGRRRRSFRCQNAPDCPDENFPAMTPEPKPEENVRARLCRSFFLPALRPAANHRENGACCRTACRAQGSRCAAGGCAVL